MHGKVFNILRAKYFKINHIWVVLFTFGIGDFNIKFH